MSGGAVMVDGGTVLGAERHAVATRVDAEAGEAVDLAVAIRALDLANRGMRGEMARLAGLSDSEFGAFTCISELDRPTPKALALELHLTTGAVTSMIDRLESSGVIERRSHPSDRRSTVLALTGAGAELREWVYGSYRRAIADAVHAAAGESTAATIRLLLRASAAVRDATAMLADARHP